MAIDLPHSLVDELLLTAHGNKSCGPAALAQLVLPMMAQTLVAILVSTFIYYAPTIYQRVVNNLRLRSIPTVGCSGLLTSYSGARRFVKHARSIVQEGYSQYRGSIFKISTMRHWIIVVSGSDKIDDMRCASDERLSKDLLDLDVSFGTEIFDDPVHVEVVRSPLTRNIGARFHDVREEILAAFNDHIPIKSGEWIKVEVFSTMMEIICRADNRMLVGLPLCRNPDYLDLSKKVIIDIVETRKVLNRFPRLLKPIVARFLTVTRSIERGMKHIGPFLEERLEQEALNGNGWPERPNDVLTWLFDLSKGKQRNLKDITSRVLFINTSAVHATTTTLTNVLFDLAAHPEYIQPLREEIEEIIKQVGWCKAAIGKMKKLDSFMKESMRLASLAIFGMWRQVTMDFTFSDGTTIFAGNTIAVPTSSIHIDPHIYPDPDTFDGFRFQKMRAKEGEDNKHQFVSIEPDYFLFGQGHHACPGRFFAAAELKTLLAHVLVNYDLKLAIGGDGRPAHMWAGPGVAPNPTAEILFRKRV